MSAVEGKICPNCGSVIRLNAKFCSSCGISLDTNKQVDRTDNQPTKPSYAEPYQETGYMQGGYVEYPAEYPRFYFNLDNLLKGAGNIIRRNFIDAVTIYLIFLVLVGVSAIYLTRWLVILLSSYIGGILPAELGQLEDQQFSESWTVIYYLIVIVIANIIVAITRWIPDVIFYRRIHQKENGNEKSWTITFFGSFGAMIKYLLTGFLILLIRFLIVVSMLAPLFFVFSSPTTGSQFFMVIFFTTIIGGIAFVYFDMRLYVAGPRAAMLNEAPIEAIRGSWRTTSGNLLNILIINIGISFATSIIQSIVSRIAIPLTFFFSDIYAIVVSSMLGLAISLPAKPLISASVMYYTQLYHGEKQNSTSFKLRTSYY